MRETGSMGKDFMNRTLNVLKEPRKRKKLVSRPTHVNLAPYNDRLDKERNFLI